MSDRRLTLAGVRVRRGKTQEDVAGAMDTTQSAISRLERQRDIKVSTLADYVAATGGILLGQSVTALHVRFGTADVDYLGPNCLGRRRGGDDESDTRVLNRRSKRSQLSRQLAVVEQHPLRQHVIDSGDQRRPFVPGPTDEPSLEVLHRAGALKNPVEATPDFVVQRLHKIHAISDRPRSAYDRSLADYVAATGGILLIVATYPDGETLPVTEANR